MFGRPPIIACSLAYAQSQGYNNLESLTQYAEQVTSFIIDRSGLAKSHFTFSICRLYVPFVDTRILLSGNTSQRDVHQEQ